MHTYTRTLTQDRGRHTDTVSTSTHYHTVDTLTSRCAHYERTMFTTSLVSFVLYSVSYYKQESFNEFLARGIHEKNNNKKKNIATVTCRQSIFIVFDMCNCFPLSIGINFKQLYISKGAKHTDVSVSNSRFRFLPYKRHGSIKGNLILHNITITTGPHAETPWTPKPQT